VDAYGQVLTAVRYQSNSLTNWLITAEQSNWKTLRARPLGWTATLITAFVGLPDQQTI
jgi:hypothetical protein